MKPGKIYLRRKNGKLKKRYYAISVILFWVAGIL